MVCVYSPFIVHTFWLLLHLKSIQRPFEHPNPLLSCIHPALDKNSLLKLLPRQCQHIRSTAAEAEQHANPGLVHPHQHLITRNLLMNRGQVRCSLVAVPSAYRCSIFADDSDTHVEWKFPKAEEKGKGVANNYAGLSYPVLACIHQIPLMLGLPTAAPVILSFPGTMLDSCLSPCRL